jgi:hypothetical protein
MWGEESAIFTMPSPWHCGAGAAVAAAVTAVAVPAAAALEAEVPALAPFDAQLIPAVLQAAA